MKNGWFAVLALALSMACATSGGAPDVDPIIGQWIGSYDGTPFDYTFNADNTVSSADGKAYFWARDTNGAYQLLKSADEKAPLANGVMEREGLLALSSATSPDRVLYLRQLSKKQAAARVASSPQEGASDSAAPEPSLAKPNGTVSAAVDPDKEPILGEWVGSGIYKILKVVFKADKTVVVGEEQSFWTRNSDGSYLIYYKEGDPPEEGMKVDLKPDGRIGLVMDQDFGDVIPLSRPGTAKSSGPPPDSKRLVGEWTYVYTKNAIMPAAPGYSSIAFDGDGGVRWITPHSEKDIKGKVKVKKQTLTFSGKPAGPQGVDSGDFEFRFEDDGKTLILAPQSHSPDFTADWVFKQPAEILANPIAGTWITKSDVLGLGIEIELEVLTDGRRTFTKHLPAEMAGGSPPPPDSDGHFIFWKSALGPAVTQVMLAREMGMFTFDVMLYELNGDTLTTTSVRIDPDGNLKAIEEMKMTWTRK